MKTSIKGELNKSKMKENIVYLSLNINSMSYAIPFKYKCLNWTLKIISYSTRNRHFQNQTKRKRVK